MCHEDFPRQEVEALNLGRAFIDQRNAAVVNKLLDTGFADKAVTSKNLHRIVDRLEPTFGEEPFNDGCEEIEEFLSLLLDLRICCEKLRIHTTPCVEGKCTTSFDETALIQ